MRALGLVVPAPRKRPRSSWKRFTRTSANELWQLDGIEATKRIRAMEKGTGQHLPIIAMTSYAMQCDRQTCIAAGMDYYLSKPFDNRSLLNLMLTAGKTPNQ